MKFIQSVLSLVSSRRLQEESDGLTIALIIVEVVPVDIWVCCVLTTRASCCGRLAMVAPLGNFCALGICFSRSISFSRDEFDH